MTDDEYLKISADRIYPITLSCPHCGEGYLHHGDIIVYQRGEDAAQTQVVRIGMEPGSRGYDPVVSVRRELSEKCGNPSSRRDGFAISFSCECCEEGQREFELTFAQHKGATHIEWRGVYPSPLIP
jgi:hypothetical protein